MVSQAHIHFGQKGAIGGVSVFLCSNSDRAPDGVPACPDSGMVSGSFTAADVRGPSGQGIAAGELGEVMRAMGRRATYVNVHSSEWPGGELRGQIRRGN